MNLAYKQINFLFLLLLILISIYPEIDLYVSKLFYSTNSGFYLAKTWFARALFVFIPYLTKLFVTVCFVAIIFMLFKKDIKRLNLFLYLIIAAAIGPGLIVNSILKGHFGRARPSQVEEFGGNHHFTEFFQMADQCQTNCSFSSGHAAMAFYFSTIAYVLPIAYQRTYYYIANMFGLLIGFVRIAQGGHFFSDVIFSGLIVNIISHLIFFVFFKR